MKVDVLIWSVDSEGVRCVFILHFVLVLYKCKRQDVSEPILEDQDVPQIWQGPFSITVGSTTTLVYVHRLSCCADIAK